MRIQSGRSPRTVCPGSREAGRYRWVALMNTTMAVFMSSLDGSIILIFGVAWQSRLPSSAGGGGRLTYAPARLG
jgi:hypothetical protein